MKNFAFALGVMAFSAAPAFGQQVPGTIKKVDAEAGKVTIDHGPIKNLDMDKMTMVFRVADPQMLKGVKAGDKIRFDADRVNGAITVTKMVKAK